MMSLWMLGGACLCLVAASGREERHPNWVIFCCAVCGLGALAAINVTADFTGAYLPLNPLTCFVSAVLGVPGVILMLLINLI